MRINVYIVFCCLLMLIGGSYYVYTSNQTKSIEQHADSVIQECADAGYRAFCYETEVPKLLSELSSHEVFEVIRTIRKKDSGYLFCHVLAHEIGEYEVSLDPDNWMDGLAQGPVDGLCSNGYAHGAILARFNAEFFDPAEMELIIPELSIACEARAGYNPTDLHKAMCYHGMGHVIVHLTNADIGRALDTCNTIAQKDDGTDYTRVCIEGVYMQLFQPLEPEDFALIEQLSEPPTRSTVENFCEVESRDDAEFAACWREAWPFFREEMSTGKGVMSYCARLTSSGGLHECLATAVTINARHNLESSERMAELCYDLPPEHQGLCFARGANAFLEEDPGLVDVAVDFCTRGGSTEVQNECNSFLAHAAQFNFHPGSPELHALCEVLPDQWQKTCRVE